MLPNSGNPKVSEVWLRFHRATGDFSGAGASNQETGGWGAGI